MNCYELILQETKETKGNTVRIVLKGPKFYTIIGVNNKILNDSIVLWVAEDKEFDASENHNMQINDSTEEEKEYWVRSMELIDKKVKNDFQGISLKDFEKWKRIKQELKLKQSK